MQPKNAKRILLLSVVVSAATMTFSRGAKGQLPEPRRYIGLAGTYLMAAIAVELAPVFGAALAVFIATSIVLKHGEGAADTLTGVASRPWRGFQSGASVVPESVVAGKFGGTFTPNISGSWAGSKSVVKALTKHAAAEGNQLRSAKRPTRLTKTGNTSDHYIGNKTAYAEDWFGPTAAMDRAAIKICRDLGKQYDGKSELNFTTYRYGYRIQVLYRTMVGGNHFTHIHVGAKKATQGELKAA